MRKDGESISWSELYAYWREVGVCISDAPVSYLSGKELDDYTREAIVLREKARRQSNKRTKG